MKIVCTDVSKLTTYTIDTLKMGEFFEYRNVLFQRIGVVNEKISAVVEYSDHRDCRVGELYNCALVNKVNVERIEYSREQK
jgi:hypothetical protein